MSGRASAGQDAHPPRSPFEAAGNAAPVERSARPDDGMAVALGRLGRVGRVRRVRRPSDGTASLVRFVRRLLAVVLVAIVAAGGWGTVRSASAAPVPAAADGGAAFDADTIDGDDGGRSFASAFFVSRRLGADGDESKLEVLGSLVIWVLIGASFVSLALIGRFASANRERRLLPADAFARVREHLLEGRYREAIDLVESDSSFFSATLEAGLREASHGYDAMIRGLQQRSDELTADRLRAVEILNVIGQVSPMVGLFGTVYGMILAFQAIVVAGGSADPVMLAGGIGTALTTTFWGLVVAIPALTGYAFVRNQVDARTAEATLAAEELVGLFRPRPSARGAGGAGGGSGGAAGAPTGPNTGGSPAAGS